MPGHWMLRWVLASSMRGPVRPLRFRVAFTGGCSSALLGAFRAYSGSLFSTCHRMDVNGFWRDTRFDLDPREPAASLTCYPCLCRRGYQGQAIRRRHPRADTGDSPAGNRPSLEPATSAPDLDVQLHWHGPITSADATGPAEHLGTPQHDWVTVAPLVGVCTAELR